MFGWFKRKTKAVTIPQPAKSEKPTYGEIMRAKRRRAKARRKQHKAMRG